MKKGEFVKQLLANVKHAEVVEIVGITYITGVRLPGSDSPEEIARRCLVDYHDRLPNGADSLMDDDLNDLGSEFLQRGVLVELSADELT